MRLIGALAAGVLPWLPGCQQYEAAPLDLTAHRAVVDARSLEIDRVAGFVDRLRDLGAPVPDSYALDDGLDAAEGEVTALFYNASLRRARLAAGVALADFETAGLWEDPVFGFDGAEIISPSAPFEFGLVLSLTIPISGRLEVEKERAGAAYEAELRRIVDAEWTTRAAVRGAWAAWTVAEERLALLRDVIAQIERISDITGQLEAAGELSRVEARLFRVELAGRRAMVPEAALRARRTRIELLGLMGLAPDAPVELIPGLPDAELPPADDALERLIAANTELAVRRAEYRVAEESLRLEIRRQYPDITIGGGYGSEDRDDRLLLGVALPIPLWNANRAGIAEAGARRDVARAEAELTYERLARDYAVARATLDAARAQRAQYADAIAPMLDRQAEEMERIVKLGEVDTLILLETVQRQFEAKARVLDLRLFELESELAIARLLGPDEPNDPAPVADPNENEQTTRSAGGEG